MTLLLLDSFKSDHVGVTKNVRPKKGSYTPAIRDRNQIQRIQTTGLGVLTRKPCHLRNRKLTCDHFLEPPNGTSMNEFKPLRWESKFYLCLINASILYVTDTITYNYAYYYYILTTIQSQAAPSGSALLGAILGLFGDHWCMVRRPYSFTPQNRMIILPPAHTIGRGWPPLVLRNQGGGGEKVCLQLGIHSRDTYS